MPKQFTVIVTERLKHTVTVTAENAKEAKNKAHELVMNGPEDAYETESEGTEGIEVESEE